MRARIGCWAAMVCVVLSSGCKCSKDAPTTRVADAAGQEQGARDRHGDAMPPGALARLGTIRMRHTASVNGVAFSPDGKTLVSAGDDHKLRLWRLVDGSEIRSFDGHQSNVQAVAFLPSGKSIVSASWDKSVRLWDVATGTEIAKLESDQAQSGMALSRDGARLATWATGGTLTIWDLQAKKRVRVIDTWRVRSAAFSPDGKQLAATESLDDQQKRALLFDINSAVPSFFGEHDDAPLAVAFSADGKTLVTGARDMAIRVFDRQTGKTLRKLVGAKKPVAAIALSPDGKWIASAEFPRTVRVWDTSAGRLVKSFEGIAPSPKQLAFSPDSSLLAAVGGDQGIYLWAVPSGERRLSFDAHMATITSIAFFPDGKQLASSSDDATVRVWQRDTASVAKVLAVGAPIAQLALSSNGSTIATASENNVQVWDVATGALRRTLEGHTKQVHGLAFTPDAKIVSGSEDGNVDLWDAASGERLRRFEGSGDGVNGVAVSPDGKLVASTTAGAASSHDGTVRVWEIATGKLRATFREHSNWSTAVLFTPDGKTIASVDWDGRLVLRDLATGKSSRELRVSSYSLLTRPFAFDPSGKLLAFGDGWSGVRVFDVESLAARAALGANRHPAASVAFSPDGGTIASGGWSSDIILWKTPAPISDAAR